MDTTQITKIKEFLRSIKIDNLYIDDYVQYEEIDLDSPFDSIYDMIENNGGFNIEIIYYFNAMEYLSKNDPTLRVSIGIAAEYMEDFRGLNSELLASLLASQIVREEFCEYKHEINEFIINLNN